MRQTLQIGGADAKILTEADRLGLSCLGERCPSNCCTKSAPIVLNPYEIALICKASGTAYDDLLDVVDTDRANGLPLVLLPRDPACHFWDGKGCTIYNARPLACRLFPIGRVFEGCQSHIVLPSVNSCPGLSTDPASTVSDYLAGQDTALLIRMADHWIEFVSAMELLGLPDKPVTSVAFHMMVYNPDGPTSATPGTADQNDSIEDRFQNRLANARQQLPKFLKI